MAFSQEVREDIGLRAEHSRDQSFKVKGQYHPCFSTHGKQRITKGVGMRHRYEKENRGGQQRPGVWDVIIAHIKKKEEAAIGHFFGDIMVWTRTA
jgi:hypothetical protein